MSASRLLVLLLLVAALGGCREEPTTGISPLGPVMEHRGPVLEEPSPLITQPHLRRVEGGGAGPSPSPPSGGSGGGGGDWVPRHAPDPSTRAVDTFRSELEREMNERVDTADDPCDQFRDVMRSAAEAGRGPGERNPSLPSREAMRENCRELPQAFQQCLSPEYFREHLDECNEQLSRMARRGERRSEEARRQLDAIRSGRAPWPGQGRRDAERRPDAEEEELEVPAER